MNRRHNIVSICPDCGGILQPIGPEALTSAEIAADNADEPQGPRQCLLCGYTEAWQDEMASERG